METTTGIPQERIATRITSPPVLTTSLMPACVQGANRHGSFSKTGFRVLGMGVSPNRMSLEVFTAHNGRGTWRSPLLSHTQKHSRWKHSSINGERILASVARSGPVPQEQHVSYTSGAYARGRPLVQECGTRCNRLFMNMKP